jgi:hypothetical protein
MWEYLCVSVDTKMKPMSGWKVTEPIGLRGPWPDALTRLGADGWELSAALPEYMKTYTNLEHAHFVFKRPGASRPG